MSYFLFSYNSEPSKIAENSIDLNNLNVNLSTCKVIEVSQSDFDSVKLVQKLCTGYNGDIPIYTDPKLPVDISKDNLNNYINNIKKNIKYFLDNNKNHPDIQKWTNYYSQLNTLDLNSLTYPLTKSLEKYFYDLGQPSLHPLQLP